MHTDPITIHSVDTTALYRAQDCAEFFSIGLSTWWSWSRSGKIRPGIKIGPQTTVWEGSYLLEIKQQLISDAVNCRVASGLQTQFTTPHTSEEPPSTDVIAHTYSAEVKR